MSYLWNLMCRIFFKLKRLNRPRMCVRIIYWIKIYKPHTAVLSVIHYGQHVSQGHSGLLKMQK